MPILNLQVGASADDAQQGSCTEGKGPTTSSSVSITNTLSSLGNHGVGANQSEIGGYRFQNVTIPQGATINSATLTLKAQATYNASPNQIRLRVSCQAADNAGAFSATSGDLNATNRPRTTADSGVWNVDSVVAETDYSIDVTAAVQEVINRAGWVSGNAIVLPADVDTANSDAAEWQDFYTYDNTPSKAAKLDINYGAGASVAIRANYADFPKEKLKA